MDVDPNISIPVEITHYSGAKFRINLSAEDIERFNTDIDYQEHLINKYYDLYKDGFVSAYNQNEEEEETQGSEDSSQAPENLPITGRPRKRSVVDSLPSTSTGITRPLQRNVVGSMPSTSTGITRPRQWTVDDEETLIRLVSERPPLFDFRIPLKERGRTAIKNLWEEVILELNVDMTVEAISKKWKNMRDSFIRARSNINKKLASGSSAAEKLMAEKLKRNHRNYDLLMFLDDTLSTRRTTSNLDEIVLSDQEIRSPPFSPTQTPPRSRSTSRNQGPAISAQDEVFLNTIRDLGAPRELTPSQSFCLRLADGMDKLPPRIRNQLQVEFLSRLTELENLYVYNE